MIVPSLLHFVSQGKAGLEPELKIRPSLTASKDGLIT